MNHIALEEPRFYVNRHLQWMAFKQRVLEEARDSTKAFARRFCRAYLSDNRKARLLGPEGLYTHSRRSRNGKGFFAQDHLMSQALGGVNGSAHPKERQSQVSYTRSQEVTAPSEPAVTLELEEQDSSNATV